MTNRQVTVETETEETVSICDECGFSDDDENLIAYVPAAAIERAVREQGIAQLIRDGEVDADEFVDWIEDGSFRDAESTHSSYPAAHFHPKCLEDVLLDADIPDGHMTMDDVIQEADWSEEQDLSVAFVMTDFDLVWIVCLGVLIALGQMVGNVPAWPIIRIILGLGIMLAFVFGFKRAGETIHEIRERRL